MEIWDAVKEERLDLSGRLAGLSETEWNTTSLCAEWRIRDVLGHITANAEGKFGVGATFTGMLRHGFNFNRWMAVDGRQRGRQDPAEILETFRAAAGSRNKPPGAPNVSVLTDTLIHGQDMCRPLGIEREIPEARLLPVLDFVKSTFIFGAKKKISGLRLAATDLDWIQGDGPEVSGKGEALLLAMAGRTCVLNELSGEGQPTLAARFA